MNKINIISYPDNLFNESFQVLLLYPSIELKENVQDILLNKIDKNINIYYYNSLENTTEEINWLLSSFNMCDIAIIDVDNTSGCVRDLLSFLISKSKTFWLSKATKSIYSIISNNKIISLDILTSILGGTIEEQTKLQ